MGTQLLLLSFPMLPPTLATSFKQKGIGTLKTHKKSRGMTELHCLSVDMFVIDHGQQAPSSHTLGFVSAN